MKRRDSHVLLFLHTEGCVHMQLSCSGLPATMICQWMLATGVARWIETHSNLEAVVTFCFWASLQCHGICATVQSCVPGQRQGQRRPFRFPGLVGRGRCLPCTCCADNATPITTCSKILGSETLQTDVSGWRHISRRC